MNSRLMYSLMVLLLWNLPMASAQVLSHEHAHVEQVLTNLERQVRLKPAQKEKIREILMRHRLEFQAERETAKGDKLLLFRLSNLRLKKLDEDISAILHPDQKSAYEAAKEHLQLLL